MSIKLTDTQLLMLSAAAQREDRCIAAPPSLKGAAAKKTAAKLVAAGLVQEIKAKSGAYVWRQDDATGRAYSLQLTSVGLKAIAVDEAEAVEAASEILPTPSSCCCPFADAARMGLVWSRTRATMSGRAAMVLATSAARPSTCT
jgi:hypothetical protein